MAIAEILIHHVMMPLDRPYPLSFNAVDLAGLDAIVAEVRTKDGRTGWGEVTILPGYTDETVASGWDFNTRMSEVLVGKDLAAAKRKLIAEAVSQPHAASPLLTSIEILEGNPLLEYDREYRIPVLAADPQQGTSGHRGRGSAFAGVRAPALEGEDRVRCQG